MRQAALVSILLIGWLASASAAEWTVAYQGQKGKLGMAPYCKPVLLPDGRLFVWTPLFPSTLDLETGAWTRLVPEGKEAWRETLPEVRRRGTRWGNDLSFHEVDGITYPIWMTHFNQLCYVPPMKKVLFFVGGRTFAFDLKTRTWQPLQPKTSPPHVVWSAMIYDPVNEEVVLFGGGAQCDENRPGTWLFDPTAMNWRKLEQPLADQPPPRCNAPLVYEPTNRLIVVFGGDAQNRYLSDTWVYDCSKRKWRELETNVRPFPRKLIVLCPLGESGRVLMGGSIPGIPQPPGHRHHGRGEFGAETWALDPAEATWTRVRGSFPLTYWETAAYDAEAERVLLCRATSRYRKHSTFQILARKPDLTPAEEKGTLDPGEPVYKYHPPEWYGADVPPADPKAGPKLFASLEPNTWTPVKPPKNAMMRTWGSATIDTDRHEVVYWGGGHCGYCGTDVSHFSLQTLRWSSSYPPEFPGAPYSGFYGEESSFLLPCRSFQGRPWVQHGRLSYVYDPTTKTCTFTQSISRAPTRGWTYVYDPAKREFVDRFPQPFIPGWAVSGLNVATPHGVYCYLSKGDHRSKQVGLFRCDVKAGKWANVSGGKAPVSGSEKNRIVYDSKRDRLVLLVSRGPAAMFAWDLKAEQPGWAKLEMTGDVPKSLFREGVYVPEHDTILDITGGRLYACDLSAGNRWAVVNQIKAGVNTSLVYDPGLDVLVWISGGNRSATHLRVMRYVPKKEETK